VCENSLKSSISWDAFEEAYWVFNLLSAEQEQAIRVLRLLSSEPVIGPGASGSASISDRHQRRWHVGSGLENV
jgi:hypothetical protein